MLRSDNATMWLPASVAASTASGSEPNLQQTALSVETNGNAHLVATNGNVLSVETNGSALSIEAEWGAKNT